MKLIKPSVKLTLQEFPERKLDMSESQHHLAIKDALYSHIEKCGRVCYKSEDKITEDSAKKFVDMIIRNGHTSVLEHGTIYLKWSYTSPADPECDYIDAVDRELFYSNNSYSRCVSKCLNGYRTDVYATTNLRVLVDNDRLDDLEFLSEKTDIHIPRVTAKFICSRQIWNEYIRHRSLSRDDDSDLWYLIVDHETERKCSYSQESTRYCNYSLGKFDGQLTFIIPIWGTVKEGVYKPFEEDWRNSCTEEENILYSHFLNTELSYNKLIKSGWKPQQAALLLPNALKTELVMTGFIDDWEHFFALRCSPAAHPQAIELAEDLQQQFKEQGLL